jgi:A/G-specific adenine glycosylase
MLQQTRISVVIPRYISFINKFPNIKILADADIGDVMNEWRGMGYYNRARNLHKGARFLQNEYDGVFPPEKKVILKIPGIGEYTANAILSICFKKPYVVLDGNVRRVAERLFLCSEQSILQNISQIYKSKTVNVSYGDINQALMDLGRLICTPKNPGCPNCPLRHICSTCKNPGIFRHLSTKKQRSIKIRLLFLIVTNHLPAWMKKIDNKSSAPQDHYRNKYRQKIVPFGDVRILIKDYEDEAFLNKQSFPPFVTLLDQNKLNSKHNPKNSVCSKLANNGALKLSFIGQEKSNLNPKGKNLSKSVSFDVKRYQFIPEAFRYFNKISDLKITDRSNLHINNKDYHIEYISRAFTHSITKHKITVDIIFFSMNDMENCEWIGKWDSLYRWENLGWLQSAMISSLGRKLFKFITKNLIFIK